MEYPQMLYRDNLNDYAIARYEPDVSELREQGYRTHAELMAELHTTDAEVADAEVADAEVADAEVTDAEVTDAEVTDAEVDPRIIADADFDVDSVKRDDIAYNLDARGIDYKAKDNKTKLKNMLVAAIKKGEQ